MYCHSKAHWVFGLEAQGSILLQRSDVMGISAHHQHELIAAYIQLIFVALDQHELKASMHMLHEASAQKDTQATQR